MLAHAKDSGYAWIIVLQGFIGSSLSDGGVFAFGIFLPFYVVSLKSSAGSVALIGSLANGKKTNNLPLFFVNV